MILTHYACCVYREEIPIDVKLFTQGEDKSNILVCIIKRICSLSCQCQTLKMVDYSFEVHHFL